MFKNLVFGEDKGDWQEAVGVVLSIYFWLKIYKIIDCK